MLKRFFYYIKNLHDKGLLTLVYLFLFSPIFITLILNKDYSFSNPQKFLAFFVSIITILSFVAIVAVYYYNFFLDKKINRESFNRTTHLKKIFLSYVYIIFIFANLFYMAQYAQNVSVNKTQQDSYYFNFNKNNNLPYTNNIHLFVDCVYLSITTITTIGYGDVIAEHVYGKFLIAIEAMLGQIMWGLSMTLWFVKRNDGE